MASQHRTAIQLEKSLSVKLSKEIFARLVEEIRYRRVVRIVAKGRRDSLK